MENGSSSQSKNSEGGDGNRGGTVNGNRGVVSGTSSNRRIQFLFIGCVMAAWVQLFQIFDKNSIINTTDCIIADPDRPIVLSTEESSSLSSSIQEEEKNKLPQHLTTSNVVYIVLTRRNAFDVRQTIRETWAAGHDNVYFIIGKACPIPIRDRAKDAGGNVACRPRLSRLAADYTKVAIRYNQIDLVVEASRLDQEQDTHHDIVEMDEVDAYGTLPQKLKYAYQFVNDALPNVEWVVKVDDDFFVRIPEFTNYLLTNYGNLSSDVTMVAGDIRRQHHAFTSGKWKEVPQFPPGGLYPPFPLGSKGHVVSRPIVEYVATHAPYLLNYQGEDTSIGIWLDEAPRDLLLKNGTRALHFIDVPVMDNHRNCFSEKHYLLGHDITKKEMKACFEHFQGNTTTPTTTR
jgi:hypothetical protein